MWAQPYQSEFEKPILKQIMALIKRDFAAALAVVGQTENFNEFDLALVPVMQFPAVLVIPNTSTFDPESQLTEHQFMDFVIVIAITHQDRNLLTLKAMDYVRAMHILLEGTAGDDWYVTLPLPVPPFALGETTAVDHGIANVLRVFVGQHRWGIARRPATSGFSMVAEMPLRIEIEEN